jgi:tight adherence protein C
MMIQLLLSGGAVLLLAMFVAALMLVRDMNRQERMANRVRVIHGERVVDSSGTDLTATREAFMRWVTSVGQTIMRTGLVSKKTMSDLEKMLAASGMSTSQGIAVFVGCKIVLLIALPIIAWTLAYHMEWSGSLRSLCPAIAAVAGLLLPDWVVGKCRARYVSRLEEALPDALDMMVICAQAGLGLGPAVIRVAAELRTAYRELAYEFAMTANELQVLSDSRIALTNLGLRTELDSLKRLGSTLVQTIQYGTPLTDALKTLSSELRHEMLVKMETKAARLPVMLTMPTIVFILPCVFLIAGGPAMLQVMKMFNP